MYRFEGTSSSITFNQFLSKYYVSFHGTRIETTVTDKEAVACEWTKEIYSIYEGKSRIVVGLDVEWRPHLIRSMSNKSATLQLSVDDKCPILQVFHMGEIPEALKSFLLDPKFTFVGIEVADDILKLKNEYGLDCSSSAGIRAVAKARFPGRFGRPGLKDLALEVCGLQMKKPKHVCMSNWEAREVNHPQVEYACIDAYASYKIVHKLFIEFWSNASLIVITSVLN